MPDRLPRRLRSVVAGSLVIVFCLWSAGARAESGCADFGGLGALATGGGGALGGIVSAALSAGLVSAANESRDYSFWAGALWGAGTAGVLGLGYTLVDIGTGCSVVNASSSGISIPTIVTIVTVSALVPIFVWALSPQRQNARALSVSLAIGPASIMLALAYQ